MKLAAIGGAVAAVGVVIAIADRSLPRHAGGTTSYPPGCAVAVDRAPGYLPRAAVAIENRSRGPAQVWLEPRMGLGRVEFGQIGEGEIRMLAHALPAGRNLLRADAGRGGRTHRIVLNVANHGAATCKRRYLWRIE